MDRVERILSRKRGRAVLSKFSSPRPPPPILQLPNWAIAHRFNNQADWLALIEALQCLEGPEWVFFQHGSMLGVPQLLQIKS